MPFRRDDRAVESMVNGVATRDNISAIDTEMEHHEEPALK